ncbi:MAG: glycine cleavage system aminomethyltransferase GcvT [Planctomycetaceae bacterium]
MNLTALHDWHVQHSGRMVDFAGWEMPIQYSSIVEEHTAVRHAAGLFDIAHMGRLSFTGPQAAAFLDLLLTNDVTRLKTGMVRYSLVCNEAGGILDDVLVYRLSQDRYALVVNASNREKIVDWIGQHSPSFDVNLADRTLETFMLALQGPRSVEILSQLTAANIGDMGYYTSIETTIGDVPVLLSRTGYTGEDGFEIDCPREAGVGLWESVLSAGASFDIAPCGLGCRDTLRLEAAMPLYGHEMDETVDPLTAGLGFGVKLNRGEFIGKSALVEKSQRSDLPIRVGIELAGRRIAREGALLFHGDQQVGHVTSGTFSPTLQKAIGMAYVPKSLAAIGTEIEVDIRGKRETARVVPLPFYRRPQ